MKQTEGHRIVPVYRKRFQQRVDIRPHINTHQDMIAVLAIVEHREIDEIKCHDVDLRVFFREPFAKPVRFLVSALTDQHDRPAVQIFHGKPVFFRKRIID